MPTDDERREVARRLRGLKDSYWAGDNSSEASMDVMGVESYLRRNGLSSNLADLIEPSEPKVKCVAEVKIDGEQLEKLVHDAAVELTGIDRERLLAIATVMAADSVRSVKQGSSVSPVYILHAARNIAEACGETFGSIRNRELAKWGTSIVPKETIVDRDALLRLARYMDKDVAETEAHFSNVISTKSVSDYARRVRKACGEGA